MTTLDIPKHIAYHKRCLSLLPEAFIGNDLNRMSLGFFILNSLDTLDQIMSTSIDDRKHWIDWIYGCQIRTGGFRGSPATKTPKSSVYDTAHLPATYFAIALLLILGDDMKRLNRKGALEGLKRLQNKDGSFSPVLIGDEKYGEIDVRHVYCAIAIREMLSPVEPEEDIDVPTAIRYIQRCKGYDGGYAQSPELESHGILFRDRADICWIYLLLPGCTVNACCVGFRGHR